MPLTDVQCRKAACPPDRPRKRYSDAQGLYLEVTPAGGRYWRLKYRHGGKEKRLALGVYPEVTLAEARERRDEARKLLRDDLDPGAVKREQKIAQRAALGNTFEEVARAWFDAWKGPKSPRHADYVIRRLEADVFPAIGRLPVAEVRARDFVNVAKAIEARGALDIAKRCLQTCSQIMRYAVAHDLAERNTAGDVKPGDVLKARAATNYARLDAKEMPELLRKIASYPGNPYTRSALQLMALTFVRTSELIEATWDEFALDKAEWRIPAERMKMKTPHIVPLSSQAVDVLRCLHELRSLSPRVFPGERDHNKPMSNGAILMALRRMGYANKMTGHGFRGVASTALHEHEFPHYLIELQLAHMPRDEVSAAYNHATHLPQRRKMMQWWADHLDALRRGAKVIALAA